MRKIRNPDLTEYGPPPSLTKALDHFDDQLSELIDLLTTNHISLPDALDKLIALQEEFAALRASMEEIEMYD